MFRGSKLKVSLNMMKWNGSLTMKLPVVFENSLKYGYAGAYEFVRFSPDWLD